MFWRAFCEKNYIGRHTLVPHTPDSEVIEAFQDYIAIVLASAQEVRQTRYLSKNNNNILRLEAIQTAFPQATIIIPFRDPIQQALSLQNQHEKFLQRHKEDPFSLKYMNWLGHHEFGLNHKSFYFDGDVDHSPDAFENHFSSWVKMWLDTYSYLLQYAPQSCLFVCYERLCAEPEQILETLFEMQSIAPSALGEQMIRQAIVKEAPTLDKKVKSASYEVYHTLYDRSV